MADHDEEPTDPKVGSPEYWALPTAEQYRVAMASAGVGPSNAPAWTSSSPPYSKSDHDPIDDWTD